MEEKRGKEFEKCAKPDVLGVSAPVILDSLPDSLKVTNGSNFSRAGSYLDTMYYLIKNYSKGTVNTKVDSQKSGIGKGKLISIQLNGYKNNGGEK